MMIRSVRQLMVTIPGNAEIEKLPKGLSPGSSYPVVVERSVKKKHAGNEFEDLEFGVINTESKVIYIPMYKCLVKLA